MPSTLRSAGRAGAAAGGSVDARAAGENRGARLAYACRCGPFRRVDFARPLPAQRGAVATSVPAGNRRVSGAAGRQGGAPPGARVTTEERGRRPRADQKGCNGRRHHEAAAGQRRPLRAPDPSLEPEDEALHLHRAQRHLHHRPAADARLHRQGLRVRQADGRPRRLDPVRRHQAQAQEAIAEQATRVGMPYVNQRWLGGMLTNFQTVLQAAAAPQGARGPRADRRAGQPHQEGEPGPLPREDQARAHPRRYPRHAEGAQRRLDRRHQEGAHRRRRGPQAGHPGRSRSSTPTATPTRSTTRSRATTTRSAARRC